MLFICNLEVFWTMVKIKSNKKKDIVKLEISNKKRVSGFGIIKGLPPFKEEKEDHDEF